VNRVVREVLGDFARSLFRAVVPLVVGVVGALVAAVFFVIFLTGQTLTGFFSTASSAAIGLLVALIVNTVTATTSSVSSEGRAGTVALVTIGMIATLIGQLTISSAPVRGILFAVTWGSIAAGVLGLVFFVRGGQAVAFRTAAAPPDPAAQFSITALRAEASQAHPPPPPDDDERSSS
jgi:hypothetical protein